MANEQLIVAAAAAAVHARDHRHPSDAHCPGHDVEVVSFGPKNAKWFCHCHGLESELMPYARAHAAANGHRDQGHGNRTGPTPASPGSDPPHERSPANSTPAVTE